MHACHSYPAPQRKGQRYHPANPCEPETRRQGQQKNAGPHATHTGKYMRAWSAHNHARNMVRRHVRGVSVGARPRDELLPAGG